MTLEYLFIECPEPGICAIVLRFEERNNLATGRLAELGFLGVHILKRITAPLRCGDPFNTGRRGL